MSAHDSSRVDGVFAALADPTRRLVLQAVVRDGPTTATQLAAAMPVTRQAVAKHLGVLQDAGLVTSAREGRETRFEARPQNLRPAAEWIAKTDRAWEARLARLAEQVPRRAR